MPGGGVDLVFPDLMHCEHLGTDLILLGSVLLWLQKQYLPGTDSENLLAVGDFIKQWYKVEQAPSCLQSINEDFLDSLRRSSEVISPRAGFPASRLVLA